MAKQMTKLMTGILNKSSATRPILCVVCPVLKRNANIHCLAKQVRCVNARHKFGVRTLTEFPDTTSNQYEKWDTSSNGYERSNPDDGHICMLRGFPLVHQLTPEKVMEFLKGVNIVGGAKGVRVGVQPRGLGKFPSVQVFVELESAEDVEKALQYCGKYIGSRFIEVYKQNRKRMIERLHGHEVDWGSDCTVKVTGLPVGWTHADLIGLFSGLDIVAEKGIVPFLSDDSQPGAFVEFSSEEMKKSALKLQGAYIRDSGPVKIEPSSPMEMALSEYMAPRTQKHSPTVSGSSRGHFIHLFGLPFTATADDIMDFLGDDVKVVGGKAGIYMTLKRGFPGGEAFLELMSESDVQNARLKDRNYMGERYIDVRSAEGGQIIGYCRTSQNSLTHSGSKVVKLFGMPYEASDEDVANFFQGLEIAPDGIIWAADLNGKTVMKYVEFTSSDDAEQALRKHMKYIGTRYIGVVRSCKLEADYDQYLPPPRQDKKTDDFRALGVYLRGLPYGSSEDTITEFFKPLVPTKVELLYNKTTGVKTGEANVYFSTNEEVMGALKKDYEYIGSKDDNITGRSKKKLLVKLIIPQ